MSKSFYSAAYTGAANNSWSGNPDRLQVVRDQVQEVEAKSLLDIGCGQGLHTTFIATEGIGTWTGVDIVDADVMKLCVPEEGRFAVADLASPEGWEHPFLADTYGVVVDQGAVFVTLEEDATRDLFLQRVASILRPGGRFIGLVVEGDWGKWIFPDGRVRWMMSHKDIAERTPQWEACGFKVVAVHTHHYEVGHRNNPLQVPLPMTHIIFERV